MQFHFEETQDLKKKRSHRATIKSKQIKCSEEKSISAAAEHEIPSLALPKTSIALR